MGLPYWPPAYTPALTLPRPFRPPGVLSQSRATARVQLLTCCQPKTTASAHASRAWLEGVGSGGAARASPSWLVVDSGRQDRQPDAWGVPASMHREYATSALVQ